MIEMFDRILSLRVSDVMTSHPITVKSCASMLDVSHLFVSKRLHSAPVVDDCGQCIGIITSSDFVKRIDRYWTSDVGPHEKVRPEESVLAGPQSHEKVSDCMTRSIHTISPSMALIAAARIMIDAHLHVVPVVEEQQPVGILSNLDVVAAMVNAFEEARNAI